MGEREREVFDGFQGEIQMAHQELRDRAGNQCLIQAGMIDSLGLLFVYEGKSDPTPPRFGAGARLIRPP